MTERTMNKVSLALLILLLVTLLGTFIACLCTSYGRDDTLKYYGHYQIYNMRANADNKYAPLSATFYEEDGKPTYPKEIWLEGGNGQGSFNHKVWHIAHIVSTKKEGVIVYSICTCSPNHDINGSIWDKDPYALERVDFFTEKGIYSFSDFYNYYKDNESITFIGKY